MSESRRPFGCRCSTLAERLTVDGCEECAPKTVDEQLRDALELLDEYEREAAPPDAEARRLRFQVAELNAQLGVQHFTQGSNYDGKAALMQRIANQRAELARLGAEVESLRGLLRRWAGWAGQTEGGWPLEETRTALSEGVEGRKGEATIADPRPNPAPSPGAGPSGKR